MTRRIDEHDAPRKKPLEWKGWARMRYGLITKSYDGSFKVYAKRKDALYHRAFDDVIVRAVVTLAVKGRKS